MGELMALFIYEYLSSTFYSSFEHHPAYPHLEAPNKYIYKKSADLISMLMIYLKPPQGS